MCASNHLLTRVCQDFFSRSDVDKLLLRLLLLCFRLEVVRMKLLSQLPVRLDDLLLISIPEGTAGRMLH